MLEPDIQTQKEILAVAAAGGIGFAAGAIKVMADGKERSMKMVLAAILGGGLFGGGVGAGLIAFTELDPMFIAFISGMMGSAGDHIIVGISTLSERWRTKPKDALKDVNDLISGKGE